MRLSRSLAPLLCGLVSAAVLGALVFARPALVLAKDKAPGATTCSCPKQGPEKEPDAGRLWPKPSYAQMRPRLDPTDEIATLEAVHLALTEVGDGSAYVWHRRHGRLSGVVEPIRSFRDADGKVCRLIVLTLSAEGYSRRAEGIACRLKTGVWELEG